MFVVQLPEALGSVLMHFLKTLIVNFELDGKVPNLQLLAEIELNRIEVAHST